MGARTAGTTQMFEFVRRCQSSGLKQHLSEVINSAILAEETRMAFIRAKISNGDAHGAKIVFREHYKSYNECVNKLNQACRQLGVFPPAYSMLDLFNVFV